MTAMALGRGRLQLLPALLQVSVGTTGNGAEVHQHHVQRRLGMDPVESSQAMGLEGMSVGWYHSGVPPLTGWFKQCLQHLREV